jgi:pyruvate ferredoxin oxidoreductase gamma subunit
MIRIRFHGRGGQGMKTASRVVGTAALLDGFVAQDSPVYGAERRGAPMSAYTRISREAILERGLIANPEIVVVADDTLLDDPSVQPLAGLSSEGVLLISSIHSPDELREHTGYQGIIEGRDFLALALEEVGSSAGVSTALAAAACRLLDLSEGSTEEALRRELPQIGLDPHAVGAGLRLAERARVGIEPIEFSPPTGSGRRPGSTVVDVTYAPPEVGTPSVTASANTPLRRTGNWRVFKPVVDLSKCTQCWICFVRCPDGAILLDSFENPYIDYEVCKGCLICVEECPTDAISKLREVREWVEAGFER